MAVTAGIFNSELNAIQMQSTIYHSNRRKSIKCLYYLTSTLDSTRHITDDLHEAGIDDWFIHVLSEG